MTDSVVHVVPRLTLGGASRVATTIASNMKRLYRQDHQLLVLGKSSTGGEALARQQDVPVSHLESVNNHRRWLKQFDIVHLHYWNSPELYSFYRSPPTYARLLLWCHVNGQHDPQRIPEHLLRGSARVVFTSYPSYRSFCEDPRYDDETRSRFCHILSPMDPDRLDGFVREPHERFNLVYVGVLDHTKLRPDFIDTVKSIPVDAASLHIYGVGSMSRELQSLAADDSRIHFHGYATDLREVFSSADVFVYPLVQPNTATSELVVQEAQYCGVPVVGFRCECLTSLVRHGETGLLADSPDELVQHIVDLYTDRKYLRKLSESASVFARRAYNPVDVCRRLAAHYEAIRADTKKPLPDLASAAWRMIDRTVPDSQRGALYFVYSLQEQGDCFKISLTAENDQALLEADRHIAQSKPLLVEGGGGVFDYLSVFPHDAYLNLWAGLILARRGHISLAIASFTRARSNGMAHWRICWYLVESAVSAGHDDLARQILDQTVPLIRSHSLYADKIKSLKMNHD